MLPGLHGLGEVVAESLTDDGYRVRLSPEQFFGPFESAELLSQSLAGGQQSGHPPSKALLGLFTLVVLALEFLAGGFQLVQLPLEICLGLLILDGSVREQSGVPA
jgi:hypothetical protein